jgi:hypothetical protein
MVFYRALADAKVGGDILAGMAGKNHLHDLTLPRMSGIAAMIETRATQVALASE